MHRRYLNRKAPERDTALWFVVLCSVLLSVLLNGCTAPGGGERMIEPETGETLCYRAQEILLSEKRLLNLIAADQGYLLYAEGHVCRLTSDFIPSKWETEADGSASSEIGRFSRDGVEYRLTGDGRATVDGKAISLDLRAGEALAGFWAIGEDDYFVTSLKVDGETGTGIFLRLWNGQKAGEPVRLSGVRGDVRLLATDGVFGYFADGAELYRFDGKKIDSLGNLFDLGVNPGKTRRLLPIRDGFLLLAEDRLFRLIPSEEPADKPEIVIGTIRVASFAMEDAAARFNRGKHGFQVKIRIFDDEVGLNLAFLSGEIDVASCYDFMTMRNYAKKGLLVPLDSLLKERLDAGAFFPNVVEASKVDGNIFFLPTDFAVVASCLPKGLIDRYGVPSTVKELTALLDKLEYDSYLKEQCKEYALNNFMANGLSAWMDPESGQCHFDDPDFITLLEFLNRYAKDPEEVLGNYHNAAEKPWLFWPEYDIASVHRLDLSRVYETAGSGEPATTFGMEGTAFSSPTAKEKGLAILADQLLGVAKNAPHRKEAEVFYVWLFSEERYQDYLKSTERETTWGFPLSIKAAEALVARDATDGDGVSYLAEVSWKEILSSADHYGEESRAADDIVREEAMRYFTGEITAKQAAEYIQNRVSIYLAEQG